MNFQHQVDLIKAERYRVLDQKLEAIDAYDRAIAGAKENGDLQEEALGNELASKFYLNWGKDKSAAAYMQTAYDCYARWGANAKMDDLERCYPNLLQPMVRPRSQSVNPLNIFNNLPGIIYQFRIDADGNPSYPYISDRSSELLGFPAHIFQQQAGTVIQCIDPSDRESFHTYLTKSRQNLTPCIWTGRFNLPTGQQKWIESRSIPEQQKDGSCLWNGVMLDVTDRKRLALEQQRLATILETTSDYVGLATPEGDIIWINQPFRNLCPDLEWPLKTAHIFVFCPPWVNHIIRTQAFPTAIQAGTWSGELALLNSQGEEFPVSMVLIAHKTTTGEVEYFSIIGRDIRDRKHTEAALRLSKARAKATFDQAAIGFVEIDVKTKQCARVNNHFCKLLGYTSTELIGMTVANITHPEDIAMSKEMIQKLYSGEINDFTLEKRYLRKDGTCFWSETTVYLVELQDGEAIYSVGLVQDISEKKQLEVERQRATLALQLSEARANAAFKQAAVGIAESNIKDGKITRTNSSFCTMMGYTAQELESITSMDLTHPEDRWLSRDKIQQLYTGEIESFQIEKRYRRQDDSVFWGSTTVSLVQNPEEQSPRCLAVVQDISDRKAAEQELMLTQFAQDYTAIGIFWVNSHGQFTYANESACMSLGYTPEELKELHVWDISYNFQAEAWPAHWLEGKENGFMRFEAVHQAKDGRLYPVEIISNYLEYNSTGYVFAQVQDISDRKASEAQLQQLNTELEQRVQERTQELSEALETLKAAQNSLVEVEKMAALGNLVAGVAHEINTPIGTSITVASTLADETDIFLQAIDSGQLKRSVLTHYTDVVQKCSSLINSNLGRAGDLVQSFKQVAVDQTHQESRTFNLKAYLQEVVTSLQPQVRRSGHHLSFRGESSISLTSNPGFFAQIVTNLVTNSISHAYPSGEFGQLQLQIDQQEHQIILQYGDDGCGIPEHNLSKVYEPFFTTARNRGGTGLGLNIIYNIVTQSLKGTIAIQSQEGQGTKFTIALPVN